MKVQIIAVLLLAAFAAGCAKRAAERDPPVAEPATARTIAQGELTGTVAANGAQVWRAIPYAAPPVGDLRWRAPRPALAWDGVREAVAAGERCVQLTNGFHQGEGLEPGLVIGSEDCLTLDIYAPAGAAPGDALPVMMWIHGGGNVWGRSSAYDASVLADRENVIVVAVQYRLGPLGWFAHAALRDSAETPEDAAANFGTLDLIAALAWIRDNIGAFGGDAGRVTVFGESAGGHNVATLLASPLAKGLFHRAIIQSGSFDSFSLAEAEGALGALPNTSADIAERLGAASAAELRAVSAEALHRAYEIDAFGYLNLPLIIEDGVALPASDMLAAFSARETFNAVPIITGTNRDEMKLFQIFDPRLVKRPLGVFVVARDPDFYDATSDYMSRLWRILAVDEPARAMSAAGHADIYAYRFDWDEGGRFLITDTARLLGAAHAMEIPFVLGRFELFGELDPLLFGAKTEATRTALSEAMGGYWASFARDGAPGHGGRGLPRWEAWREGGALMRLDSATDGGPAMMGREDALDLLLTDMGADPRLDAGERCVIARGIAEWRADVAEKVIAALGCPQG